MALKQTALRMYNKQILCRKFALRNRKMHVFSLIFIPSFPFLYHFDTVLGAFFGLGGPGGGGGDSPHPHRTLEGKTYF